MEEKKIRMFVTSILTLLVFVLLKPSSGFAYEEDKFGLDLSLGYGVSSGLYPQRPFMTSIVGPLPTYGSLIVTYAITPRMRTYLGIPFGIVDVERITGSGRKENWLIAMFGEFTPKYGIGDVFGGIDYYILPNISLHLQIDSDTADYSSGGNGTWDYTVGMGAKGFLTSSSYLFGKGVYTYPMKRFDSGLDDSPGFDDNPDLNDSVNLSEIVGYGGGVGFLTGRGQKVIEAELYMTKSEKDEDLGFTIGFSPGFKLPFLPFQPKATTFTMRGLNKGLNRDNIYYGFEISLSTS